MNANVIRLLEGERRLTLAEFKKFDKLDSVIGVDSNPVELKRWSIEDKDKAIEELSKYKNKYSEVGELVYISEYVLEYSERDEDDELVDGCDYEPAEEA